jgi:hypothetical protein
MKMNYLSFCLCSTLPFSLVTTAAAANENWRTLCEIETLPLPKNLDPQVGGIGVTDAGSIFVTLHRGEILKHDGKSWKQWGHGLHEPLGLHVENEHSIVVIQRAELTRIEDLDKDGEADSYQNLCSSWGLSGNYHEFAFGPAKASDGSFFVSLGTASQNGGTRPEIRGTWNDAGNISHADTKPSWQAGRAPMLPRMYARVDYRGWVIKVNPNNGTAIPYASGLRTPHGIHVTRNGDLYINDNQGDWLGSSKLYKIEKDKFYGHADSLIWHKGWNRGVPAKLPPAELDQLRTKEVAFIPQGDLANSPTQIITLPEQGFGPYNNALIMGEMNQPRLVRYMPDSVKGVEQGTMISFMEHPSLGVGNSKMTVMPPSTLLIGKTQLSWPGDKGILKVTYNDKLHLAITGVKLTPKGFDISFNGEVDSSKIVVSGENYSLAYHAQYGAKKENIVPLKANSLSTNGKTLHVELSSAPIADRVYDLTINNCSSPELGKLIDTRFFYTANQVH